MIKIISALVGTMLLGVSSYGIGDATKVIARREDNGSIETTYARDGVVILKIMESPRRDILHQSIMLGKVKVATIFRYRDEQVHSVESNVPVSVSFTYSAEGRLSQVELAKEGFYGLEIFSVEDGRLTPITGKKLMQHREFSADLDSLFDRDKMKGMTNEEFVQKALETALRHRQRTQQDSDGNAEKSSSVEREP